MVGRNELCPCGSGRKYKKCCLEKDRAKDIARNRVKLGESQFESVIQKVTEFSSEHDKTYRNKCEIDFGVTNYELENLMNVYYFANYKYNKQSSIMLDYFSKNKASINKNDEEIIENTLSSYMSIYQVKEKDINKIALRDILLNEDVYVEDIDLFSTFRVGEFLLARIVNIGGTKIFVDKTVKINESRKTRIKNDIDNRYKQTKKKCKTKKQCLINNIKFMYQNLITVRREYIAESPCDTVETNTTELLNKTLVHNNINSTPRKSEKQKERDLKLLMVQQREKEIAQQINNSSEKNEKPIVQHGEKEIIIEVEQPIAQKTKEKIKKQIALPIVQLIKEESIKQENEPIVQQVDKEIIIEVEQPTVENTIKQENQKDIKEINSQVTQEIKDTGQENKDIKLKDKQKVEQKQVVNEEIENKKIKDDKVTIKIEDKKIQPEVTKPKIELETVKQDVKGQENELVMNKSKQSELVENHPQQTELVMSKSEQEIVADVDDEGVASLVSKPALELIKTEYTKLEKEEAKNQDNSDYKQVTQVKQRKQVMARKARSPEGFRDRKVNKRLEAKLKQRIQTTKRLEGMRFALELIRQEKLIKERESKLRERELQLEKQLAKLSLESRKKEPEKVVAKQTKGEVKNKDCNVEIKSNDSPNKIEAIPIYKAEQIESKIENISMSKLEQQIESKIENNIVARLTFQEQPEEKVLENKDPIKDTEEIKIKQEITQEVKKEPIKKKCNNKKTEEQCKIYDILMLKVEDEYKDRCIKAWKKFKKIHKSYKGSESGWAAAIEYEVRKNIDDTVTQEQISKKYDISARTLGKRYKELQIS
ncbi:MAG: SEC-C metal-binding domain-containing protein [Intestinibacter bartlettii]|uniref:SEC-C metal-binding domain-containing protein n=1 Tax=Intestinibacter bartlettii TaxID=261299 RepID=UPI0026EFB182|nr:SEC-C metal-binding domain-containing protein [Intestinibacter bartlettii]MDO5009210.1 SEC-C metal-binding domain-containing protein [Intestinibacter bartlettii]